MIGSIKLLIATLSVSQFSGVVEADGDFRKKREQLRRNLRSGNENEKAQIDKNGRKMQFLWEDPTESEAESYDDYFDLPEEVEDAGLTQDDDFFEHTETGMVFNWDGAEAAHVEEEHSDDHSQDRAIGFFAKSSKKGGLGLSEKAAKLEKAAKVGKMTWDETPLLVKSSKKGKKSKSSKKFFGKSEKSAYSASGYEPTYYYSYTEEEEESADGWLSAFDSTGTLGYADLFGTPAEVEARAPDDDYDWGSATTGADILSGRVDGVQGRNGYTFDDDFFDVDERVIFMPRPVVTLAGSIFSVNPQTVIPPVVPDGSGNTLTLGTEYLFNEVMTDAQNINSQLIPIAVDNEQVLFVVAVDGLCNRIGPADQNSVQGYCFLTYTFIDPQTQMTSGSFTAQGIIVNAAVPGQLTISGGTGVLTGATGLVEILPAAVDNGINPPLLIQPPVDADPFNGVAGWAHFFEFDVDVLFFLPELYSSR